MVKRILILVIMILFAVSCIAEAAGIDVDLTMMSGTVVYAQVFDMVSQPEFYIGQTVRMHGVFAMAEGADRNYYACVIADAAACCAQGIEFVLQGSPSFPDDYPELGTRITVQGTFDTYMEDGVRYCQLINASFC